MKDYLVLDAMFLIFIEETEEPRTFFNYFYNEKEVTSIIIPRSVIKEVNEPRLPYHKVAHIRDVTRMMSFVSNRLSSQDKDVIEIAQRILPNDGDKKANLVISDDTRVRKVLKTYEIEHIWVSEVIIQMLEDDFIETGKYEEFIDIGSRSLTWSKEVEKDLRSKTDN